MYIYIYVNQLHLHIFIYTYILMYICTCIYMYTHIYIYIYIYIHTHMYAASCSCTFLSTCVFHSDRLPPRAYTLSHTIAHAHILFNPQTYTDPGWKGRQDSRGGMEKRALLGVTVPLGIWVEWGNVVCLVGRARMARRCLCVAVCCSMVQYGAVCCSGAAG